MEIRQKITFQFVSIVAVLLFIALLVIYLLFSGSRQEGFQERLANKAKSIAQLIAETENVETSLLKRIERNSPTGLPKEKVIAYNLHNEVLYHSNEMDTLLYSPEFIGQIIEQKEYYSQQEDIETYGFYYEGEKEKVVVVCSAVDVFGHKKMYNLRLILILVYSISLIVVFTIGRIFSTQALAPISDVMKQVNEIDISNISKRVIAGNGKDEIARLATTFNGMMARLEEAFQIQKDFIANSSHELRTPLTAITGHIEVALLKERSEEEYKNILISVLDEIKGLNALTNRLLLLTKVSSYVSSNTFKELRIDEVLWKTRAEILKNSKSFTVNIKFDESISGEHHFSIKGNEQLLKTAFANLIKNGCKYSSNNKVDVLLSASTSNLVLSFKDEGIGIPDDELNNIFQPFYRASNVKRKRGHGIGLSLVEKIVLLHNGTISVKTKIKKGTEFIIKLPFFEN